MRSWPLHFPTNERNGGMIRKARLLTASLAMLGFSSLAAAQSYTTLSGEELFQRFCAACHGTAGQGDGPVAGSLAVLVPDLTLIYRRYGNQFPAAQIRETIDGRSFVIAHGTRYMPVWGYEFWVDEGADNVAEEEVKLIVDRLVGYLRSIQVTMDPSRPEP
jgi:mono/diheme cytochrome c family protein